MQESEPPKQRKQAGNHKAKLSFGVLPGLIGYNLRRAQIRAFQNFQAVMAPFEITPGQFGVLELIHNNPGLSQSNLGAALGIDRSTMVAVIDRLEGRGLVVRAPSPRDRRSYALRLSAKGDALLRAIAPKLREHEAAIATQLTAAEQAELIDMLQRISKGT